MIVCKFGGTSVGDAPAIRRAASIVRSRLSERPLVVVSALPGVTSALLGLVGSAAPTSGPALETGLRHIAAQHRAVAQELGIDASVPGEIDRDLVQLGSLIANRSGPADDELLDFVSGQGELWNSRIVAAAFAVAGVAAEWVDVRLAMRTDASFGRARPDRASLDELAPALFNPILTAGRVPVTQGFIGAAPDGRPTTLGRGGSDFTAALLGAVLDARRVEIWTDVDGLMTADPRIVPQARLLQVASHHEAAELAAFGAKVLHPATQAPLVAARIPCVVLNSFAPDGPGTTILSGVRPAPLGTSPVRSISCKRGVTVLNVRAPDARGSTGFLRALFEVFERHDVAVDVIATSEVNVSVTIDDPARLAALRTDLEPLGEVSVFPGRAIIAVVGIGLRGTRGLSARIFTAVQAVNVEVISQGASEINVTFVVQDADAETAVRRLHETFIEADPPPP